ncbi:MAG: HAMP domain-containing sensor histidine kinase [Nitrospiraceae bacterium]|nr:HAMP domain-containing sensor histidine kinase [Nitrospiraceae bacterium]
MKLLRSRVTVAFRLTIWYVIAFALSSFAAFLVLYVMMISDIHRHTDKALVDKAKEFSLLLNSQGVEAVRAEMVRESSSTGTGKVFFRLLTFDGKELAASDFSAWKDIGIDRIALKHTTADKPVFETLAIPGIGYKVRVLYAAVGSGEILQIGHSMMYDERILEGFREIFGTAMGIVMILASLVGWFMAKRAMSGVEEVTQTAIDISNGLLDSRVPVKGHGDEIDRLASTFNSMLERIHALVTGMREITDNIAHDLRNPITRIRGVAEMTLTGGGTTNEYEAMAASIIEECDRLLGIINTMLDISEAEAGVSKLTMEDIDITQLIKDACELFDPVAEDKGVGITMEVADCLRVIGDKQKLQRMLANLLDNAIKYTTAGGSVTLSVSRGNAHVVISVNDTGVGISDRDLSRIFERFYRGDQSRFQAGSGLGLSLSRAIVLAHGGDITVTSLPGKGSTFTITLPHSS